MQHQCVLGVGMRGGGDSGYECQEDRTKDWLLEPTVCRSCGHDCDESDTPIHKLNKQDCVNTRFDKLSKPIDMRYKDSSDAQEVNDKRREEKHVVEIETRSNVSSLASTYNLSTATLNFEDKEHAFLDTWMKELGIEETRKD